MRRDPDMLQGLFERKTFVFVDLNKRAWAKRRITCDRFSDAMFPVIIVSVGVNSH